MPEPICAAPRAFSSDVLTDAEIASLRIFLSWPMRDVADRFGMDVAFRLITELGGQQFALTEAQGEDHPIAACAGIAVLRFLAGMPGTDHRVTIPKCTTALSQIRKAEVRKLVEGGANASDLARRYRVHIRSGHAWKSEAVREIRDEIRRAAAARPKASEPTAPLLSEAEVLALDLPLAWPLADVAGKFGTAVALRLARDLGGRVLKLPGEARASHPIAACAGIEVLGFVLSLPRSEHQREFTLPASIMALRRLRRAEISTLVANGGGLADIVQRFNVDVSVAIAWLTEARAALAADAEPTPPDPPPAA